MGVLGWPSIPGDTPANRTHCSGERTQTVPSSDMASPWATIPFWSPPAASTSSTPRWSSRGKAARPGPFLLPSTWPMRSSCFPPSIPSMCLSSAHRSPCIQGYKDRGYAQCTRGLCSCSVRETSCPPTQTASPIYTSAPAAYSLELLLCRI
ncbi:hypothetical protein LEMLEM_LOCUS14100 [Lemmus lemmus]